MTDLNHLAPAVAPVTAGASALPAAQLPPHAQVNSAILALSTAVTTAESTTTAIETLPLNALPEFFAKLHTSIDGINVVAAELCSTVSLVLSTMVPVPAASAPVNTAPAPASTPAPNNSFIQLAGPWIAGGLYGIIPAAPLTAIVDHNEKWFSITRGRYVGLTNNSAISLNAVSSVPSALSDRCNTQAEALQHFNAALAVDAVAVLS